MRKQPLSSILIIISICVFLILYNLYIFTIAIPFSKKLEKNDIVDIVATVNIFEVDNTKVKIEMKVDLEDVREALRRYENSSRVNSKFWDIKPLMHNPFICSKFHEKASKEGNKIKDFKSNHMNDGWVEIDDVEANHEIDWFMYVHSSVKNTELRQVIRKTWGRPDLFKNYKSRVVFVVGKPQNAYMQKKLNVEFEIYKDIIQGDFMDTYKNLTYKAVFSLRWISAYCKHVPIIMKADDDSFLNMFQLKKYLLNYTTSKGNGADNVTIAFDPKELKIICPLYEDNVMPILRDKKTCMKWCVDRHDLPGRTGFPRYCSGIAYFITQSLVELLFNQSKTTPYFWIDDVYVTGLLPQKIPNIYYVSMSDETTLQHALAVEEYKNRSKPIRYNVVHSGDTKTFAVLWNTLLKRLNKEDIESLTSSVEDLKLHSFSF